MLAETVVNDFFTNIIYRVRAPQDEKNTLYADESGKACSPIGTSQKSFDNFKNAGIQQKKAKVGDFR